MSFLFKQKRSPSRQEEKSDLEPLPSVSPTSDRTFPPITPGSVQGSQEQISAMDDGSSLFSGMTINPQTDEGTKPAEGGSAFAFMSGNSSIAPSATEPAPVEDNSSVVSAPSTTGGSAFGFISSAAPVPEDTPAASDPAPPTGGSAFGFMSASAVAPAAPAPETPAKESRSGSAFGFMTTSPSGPTPQQLESARGSVADVAAPKERKIKKKVGAVKRPGFARAEDSVGMSETRSAAGDDDAESVVSASAASQAASAAATAAAAPAPLPSAAGPVATAAAAGPGQALNSPASGRITPNRASAAGPPGPLGGGGGGLDFSGLNLKKYRPEPTQDANKMASSVSSTSLASMAESDIPSSAQEQARLAEKERKKIEERMERDREIQRQRDEEERKRREEEEAERARRQAEEEQRRQEEAAAREHDAMLNNATVSLEEKMANCVAHLQSQISVVRRSHESIRNMQRELTEKKTSAMEELNSVKRKIEQSEEAQVVASEKEDYEKAAELDVVIQRHEGRRSALEKDVASVEKEFKALDDQKKDLIGEEIKLRKQNIAELRELKSSQEKVLNDFVSAGRERLSTEHERLSTERERIEVARKHVTLDAKLLADEEATVNTSIETKTSALKEERDEHQAELDAVQTEIAELERKLAEKKEKEAKYLELVGGADAKIKTIVAKYEKQTARIEERKAKIQAEEDQINADDEAIEAANATYEKEAEKLAEQEKEQQGVVAIFGDEVEKATKALANVEKSIKEAENIRAERVTVLATKADGQSQLDDLRKEQETCQEDIQQLTAKLLTVQSASKKLAKSIREIDERLPEMEAEKKLAVVNRNFKEAGRISGEIKQMQAEKESGESLLATQGQEVTDCESNLAARKKTLGEVEAKLEEVETNVDLQRLSVLAEKKRKINKLLRRALKNDIPDMVDMLNADINYLMAETRELRRRRGLPDKAESDSEEDDAEPEQEQEPEPEPEPVPEEKASPEDDAPSSKAAADQSSGSESGPDEAATGNTGPTMDASSLEKALADKRAQIEALSVEQGTLESELGNAIEEENFELCDELNGKLTSNAESLKQATDELAELEKITPVAAAEPPAEPIEDGATDEDNSREGAREPASVEATPETPDQPISDEAAVDESAVDAVDGDEPHAVEAKSADDEEEPAKQGEDAEPPAKEAEDEQVNAGEANGLPDESGMAGQAESGDVDISKFLKDNAVTPQSPAQGSAAGGSDIDITKFLKENATRPDRDSDGVDSELGF